MTARAIRHLLVSAAIGAATAAITLGSAAIGHPELTAQARPVAQAAPTVDLASDDPWTAYVRQCEVDAQADHIPATKAEIAKDCQRNADRYAR